MVSQFYDSEKAGRTIVEWAAAGSIGAWCDRSLTFMEGASRQEEDNCPVTSDFWNYARQNPQCWDWDLGNFSFSLYEAPYGLCEMRVLKVRFSDRNLRDLTTGLQPSRPEPAKPLSMSWEQHRIVQSEIAQAALRGKVASSASAFEASDGIEPTPSANHLPPKIERTVLLEWARGYSAKNPDSGFKDYLAAAKSAFPNLRVTERPIKDVIIRLGVKKERGNPAIKRK